MYNAYFGLSCRPFPTAPQADQYYPAAAIEGARQTLARCIRRAEGPALLVGPSGTGKTLLCRLLAAQSRDSLKVASLANARLGTSRNLFQAVLYELGQPYRGMDEGELRLALLDYLTTNEDSARGVLLLVDEAHNLPLRLLEEIRILSDVARDGRPQVRLVMAGACVLEERFAHPRLDSFSQRLVARCYLESFNCTETQQYIHTQIASAGGSPGTIFPEGACRSVHQATGGVPRLINQVCDHALLLAYASGRRQLQTALVEEAWADLQQLPAPLSGDAADRQDGVIEFGGLDDSSTDDAQPAGKGVSVPPLRISPESEECDGPAQRLEGIQQMLDDVQDDFQPAGSIGPELELVFADPFDEQFEHEEIVTERYGDAAGGLPEPASSQTDQPGQDRPSDSHGDPPQGPAEPAEVDEFPVARRNAQPESLPLHPGQPRGEPDDGDVLIVEDTYDDEAASAACPVLAAPRSQGLSRLFTKLRHG